MSSCTAECGMDVLSRTDPVSDTRTEGLRRHPPDRVTSAHVGGGRTLSMAVGCEVIAQRVRFLGPQFANTSHLAEPTPSRGKMSAFMLVWSTHPFWVY